MTLTEKRKKWIWKKLTPAVILILALISIIIYSNKGTKEFNKNAKYTIGVTIGTYRSVASGKYVKFKYNIKGKSYIWSSSINYYAHTKIPGGIYYVKFDSLKPNDGYLLQNLPVPDSIKSAPPAGWKMIPGIRYFIGKIDYVFDDGRASVRFYFRDKYEYEDSKKDLFQKEDIGKRCYISLYPDDLDFAFKAYPIFVSDTTFSPKNGWSRLPVSVH